MSYRRGGRRSYGRLRRVITIPKRQHTRGYQGQWKVSSRSKQGEFYKVSLTDRGEWQCSCPHWKFRLRKVGGECKHIREVKARIRGEAFERGRKDAEPKKVVEVHNTLI